MVSRHDSVFSIVSISLKPRQHEARHGSARCQQNTLWWTWRGRSLQVQSQTWRKLRKTTGHRVEEDKCTLRVFHIEFLECGADGGRRHERFSERDELHTRVLLSRRTRLHSENCYSKIILKPSIINQHLKTSFSFWSFKVLDSWSERFWSNLHLQINITVWTVGRGRQCWNSSLKRSKVRYKSTSQVRDALARPVALIRVCTFCTSQGILMFSQETNRFIYIRTYSHVEKQAAVEVAHVVKLKSQSVCVKARQRIK